MERLLRVQEELLRPQSTPHSLSFNMWETAIQLPATNGPVTPPRPPAGRRTPAARRNASVPAPQVHVGGYGPTLHPYHQCQGSKGGGNFMWVRPPPTRASDDRQKSPPESAPQPLGKPQTQSPPDDHHVSVCRRPATARAACQPAGQGKAAAAPGSRTCEPAGRKAKANGTASRVVE